MELVPAPDTRPGDIIEWRERGVSRRLLVLGPTVRNADGSTSRPVTDVDEAVQHIIDGIEQ